MFQNLCFLFSEFKKDRGRLVIITITINITCFLDFLKERFHVIISVSMEDEKASPSILQKQWHQQFRTHSVPACLHTHTPPPPSSCQAQHPQGTVRGPAGAATEGHLGRTGSPVTTTAAQRGLSIKGSPAAQSSPIK